MNCKNCNNQIDDDIKFCGKCGFKIEQELLVQVPEKTVNQEQEKNIEVKNKNPWEKKIISTFLIIIIFTLFINPIFRFIGGEFGEKTAIRDSLMQLKNENNPIGMFGVKWYMSQEEVKNLYQNTEQVDSETIARLTEFHGRPVKVFYNFTSNKLMQISASFLEKTTSLENMSELFYKTQEKLSEDYGTMSKPVLNEVFSPINGKYIDQEVMISEKQMGRINLVHRIFIKDGGIGEQLYMYLGKQ